jgi:ABC-2 type transport system permease protein
VTAQSERPEVVSSNGTAPSTAPSSTPPLTAPAAPLASPFAGGGLIDVFRRRYLLKLLVQKEIRARYQGSLLGLMWSYVQPLVRFCMYFFVIGLVLGLHKQVPNFAIHMFAALVGVHFFTETFSTGTRSIMRNKAIVRKMAMPREMFPVASVLVSAVNSFPQVLILFIGAVAVGWRPDVAGIFAGLLGLAIITILGTALALLFSAMNVFFRDFQNIVATLSLFTHWIVPLIYPFSKIAKGAGTSWLYYLYLCNPLTVGVLLLQRAFWIPTLPDCSHAPGSPRICMPGGDVNAVGYPDLPNHLFLLGWMMLGASLIVLVLCQLGFNKLETKFAERL